MRNMLQLLGGVAVAGAVAAGATAFTASGVTSTIGSTSVVGGKLSQTIVGAEMTAATFTVDSAGNNEDRVTGVNLTLSGAGGATLPTTSVVKVSFTGTAGGTAVADITCTYSSGTLWNCPVAGAPAKYFTAVTALAISVVTP